MRSLLNRIEPATQMSEAMFSIIMALGITAAVRLSDQQASNLELFTAILGCNFAWGVVDGVMFVLVRLFERGRKARIIKHVQTAPTEGAALDCIRMEFEERLEPLTTLEERDQIYQWILNIARRSDPETATIPRRDVASGIAIGIFSVLATLPIILPFLVFSHSLTAMRVSSLIALGMLSATGWWWGRKVGANSLGISMGVTGVGLVLVLVTIALGG